MSPSLLCAETSNECFEDDEIDNGDFLFEQWGHQNHQKINKNHNFFPNGSLLFGFPLQSDECMSLIVEKQCHHLPRKDYLEILQNGGSHLLVRKEAIDWMNKVHCYYSFGPLTAYLSINYLDRFLSNYEFPSGKVWVPQLLAVACLSLAAKMEENEVPLLVDLQVGEPKYVFEASTIQRMELLVLSTLKWRMQAVTPFSFIDYFLHKINNDQPPLKLFILQSVELILSITSGIEFLEFKASEVAAAVAISVLGETKPVDFDKAVACFIQLVAKEKVLKCLKMIQGFSPTSGSIKFASASLHPAPQSPIGVLDASCLSYKSDEYTTQSGANSSCASPDTKRRKLSMDLKLF